MAELAVVGLVSNIISFIDFGAKLLSTAHELRGSQHGTTAEIDELAHLIDNVAISNARVNEVRVSGKSLSKDEINLLDLVKDCERLADEMKKIAKKLKRSKTSWKTIEDWRIAFQFLYKRSEIESLRHRFEAIDNRVRSNFLHILQADRHSATMAEFDKIKQQQASLGIKYNSKLTEIKDELISVITQSVQDAKQRADNRMIQVTKIQSLLEEHANCSRQNRLIQSLYVPILNKRWRDIKCADQTSNRWFFGNDLRFTTWLQNGTGVYLISGKAGSGKSTLMKYAAEHSDTTKLLREWAAPSRLCTGSFYFWNLGFELQKSRRGLFQSLLYQILRATPELVKNLNIDRLEHEEWNVDQLTVAFQQLSHATMNSKYCFFIDGLDEYDGQESEVVEILEFLTNSEHIKICTSSRYRFIFEHDIKNIWHKVDIAVHTKPDMVNHVRNNLLEEPSFKQLHADDRTGCDQIVSDIAEYAKGVWLWVALVTKDLVQAVKTGEQVKKLQEITKNFPRGLNNYFKAMIERIDPVYQSDMAKILLLAINARDPLPLFAFSLIELEEAEPEYAINAQCQPIGRFEHTKMKSRLHNRCGDLLVVEMEGNTVPLIGTHNLLQDKAPNLPRTKISPFLRYSVDFMHRTVAEFLRENYFKELRTRLDVSFDPMLSLCNIQLFFLKSLDIHRIIVPGMAMVSQLLRISGNILHYAREVEYRLQHDAHSPAISILDELDRVNSAYAQFIDFSCHWTGFAEYVEAEGTDGMVTRDIQGTFGIELMMQEHRNFLSLAVYVGLVNYVRTKLEEDSRNVDKKGRPLLDYVLQPESYILAHSFGVSSAAEMSKDTDMVRLLLHYDVAAQENINREFPARSGLFSKARCYDTVWDRFIFKMQKSTKLDQDRDAENVIPEESTSVTYDLEPEESFSLRYDKDAWYEICRLLIHAGADPTDRWIKECRLKVSQIMESVFDVEQVEALLHLMEKHKKTWRTYEEDSKTVEDDKDEEIIARSTHKTLKCAVM